MGDIVKFKDRVSSPDIIELSVIKTYERKLRAGLISPAAEVVADETVVDHTSEPIKSMDDIQTISDYLIQNERYRDNMLFVVGINFGLRVSDLRLLRFSNLISEDFSFKTTFPVFETKTRNTRKHKRNRYITINHAVVEAVTLYLEHTPNVRLSDYMFRNLSRNGRNQDEPIHRNSVDNILKGIVKDLGLEVKVSTHTLRKTWAYHQMVMSNNDPRKLLLLQKMLGHSSVSQTLDYIGITNEEIMEAYQNLNLGSKHHNYLIDGKLGESEILAV